VLTIRAYVRISTADQRCELQVRELREHHRTDSGEAFRDVEELIMAIEGYRPAQRESQTAHLDRQDQRYSGENEAHPEGVE